MIKKFLPAIGIALFAYLLYKIGLGSLYINFKGANFYYLLLAVIITFFYTLIQIWKWGLILRRQGIFVRFNKLARMQLKSLFYGIVTPGRIGSFVKAYYLKEELNSNLGKAVSSVIIDRILDIMSIFILAFIGGTLLVNKIFDLSYALFIAIACIAAGSYIVLNKSLTKKILGFLYDRFLPNKFKQDARESFYSFYENLPKKNSLIIPFMVNLASWIGIYTTAYFVSLSLHLEINYIVLITLYAITTVVGLVPITISGLGTREAALIGLLIPFGIEPSRIVALSLMSYFIGGILPALIGAILVLRDGNLHKTRQGS